MGSSSSFLVIHFWTWGLVLFYESFAGVFGGRGSVLCFSFSYWYLGVWESCWGCGKGCGFLWRVLGFHLVFTPACPLLMLAFLASGCGLV